jgi:hypothetical protein
MVERVRALWTAPYTTRQATYDLRRLKRNGLIVKLAHSSIPTPESRSQGSCASYQDLRPGVAGLSALDPRLPEDLEPRSPLNIAWRTFERVLDDYIQSQLTAA